MRSWMFMTAVAAGLTAPLLAASSASAQNTMAGEVSGLNNDAPTVFNGTPQWGGSQWNSAPAWGNSQWNVQGSGQGWGGGSQWGGGGSQWGGGYPAPVFAGGGGAFRPYPGIPSLSNSAPGGNAQPGTPFYNHTHEVAAGGYGNVGNYGSATGPLYFGGRNNSGLTPAQQAYFYPNNMGGAQSSNYGSTNQGGWNPAMSVYGAPINGAPNFGVANFSAPNSGTGTYGGYYTTAGPLLVPMAPAAFGGHR
jgi:hypothetical protein